MPTILAAFFDFSGPAFWMSVAGLVLLVIGLLAAKHDIAHARGLDRIVALTNLCFAMPLAVFGAEHFSLGSSMIGLVPLYMPWRLFWIYFVGAALIIASLSIATKIQVRWSGLLFGIMMILFVAMIHFPGALRTGDRIIWTIVIRELSFGGGGLVLAGIAWGRVTWERSYRRGPHVDRDRCDLFRRSALSPSTRSSRSAARKTDACVDTCSRRY